MSLRLTPEMLEASYEFLRTTPPFRAWRLPTADAIEFRVLASRDRFGEFNNDGSALRIGITGRFTTQADSLILYMAHEMIHLRQYIERTDTAAQHNARFRKLARQVCRHHGFEFGRFI